MLVNASLRRRWCVLGPLSAVLLAAAPAPAQPQAYPTAQPLPYPTAGQPDASVTIVVFSDFQCPFCTRVTGTLKALQAEYGADLRLMFVHQPLAFHGRAEPAARAAWAAHQQGAFWPMHDKLFAGQRTLDRESFERWAAELGLDHDKFVTDLGSVAAGDRIARDRHVATALGMTGTPSFLINGRALKGAQPIDKFRAIITDELLQARAAVRGGVDRNDVHAERVRQNLPAHAGRYIGWLIRGEQPPRLVRATPNEPAARTFDETAHKVPLGPDDGVLVKAAGALVTMVVFTDYQCPYCERLDQLLTRVATTFAGQVAIHIKHMPLSFHQQAEPAARAAVCAGRQGRFVGMHAALFAHRSKLQPPLIRAQAKQLGLAMPAFDKCLASKSAAAAVAQQVAEFAAAGGRGTPTSYINGRLLRGAQPWSAIETVIRRELRRAQQLITAGVATPATVYEVMQKAATAAPPVRPASTAADSLVAKVFGFAVEGRPSLGNSAAKEADLVVFYELSCPYCIKLLPTLFALVKARPKLRIAMLHFPLSSRCNDHLKSDFHPTACRGAAWAEAAHAQGRFGRFLAAVAQKGPLNGKHPGKASKALIAIGRIAGLNMRRAQRFVSRGKHTRSIARDTDGGRNANVQGTPALFVRGRQVRGPRDLATLLQLLDQNP